MSTSVQIHNAALAASAGTGKTYALSLRYIALLASKVDPATIVALTFTRKAAGEILSRILTRLAQAATTEPDFRELSNDLAKAKLPGFSGLSAAQQALRALVCALPALRIGTLDSFFLQILRQFRFEYGMASDPAIAPTARTAEEDLVLQRLLGSQAQDDPERRELREAFKRATFGEEQKSVYGTIWDLIKVQYDLFRRAPKSEIWGDATRIWPGGLPQPPALDWTAIFTALEAQLESIPTGQPQDDWQKFISTLGSISQGVTFTFKPALAERLYQIFASPTAGQVSVKIRKCTVLLLPPTQQALASVFAHIRYDILGRQIARTRGLYQLLAPYGREHHAHLVRTGQLTFNDVAYLLDPASGLTPPHLRRQMDFRLDARFSHWLLDEFQDTSLVQWAIIENLVDEIIQNGEGTFFYVGDTKQAIYQWRNGDPRLFRRILDKYNHPGAAVPAIAEADALVQSWRSSPRILEAVNQVFSGLASLEPPGTEQFQADWTEIASRWAKEWKEHEAAAQKINLAGHVALHVLPRPTAEEKDEAEEKTMPTILRAADLVQQLQSDIPDFHRFSVAILVRKSINGRDMLNALARRGIRAALTGKSDLLDNNLIPAILALAKLIEHPGDEFARQHVKMSVLAPVVSFEPLQLAAWARLIREQGYAGFTARLSTLLDLRQAPLEQGRLRLLISLAADFDRIPDGSALRFCSFVQGQEVPAEQTGSNIHILTMHKAKGLEYDIVILPDLGGNDGITGRNDAPLLVCEQDGNEPRPPINWVLSTPVVKAIDAEPFLAAQYTEDRRTGGLEELRLLYVGMTRAKRALHLVTVAPTEKPTTLRLENVVQKTLAPDKMADTGNPVYEIGEREWWRYEARSETSTDTSGAPLLFSDLPQEPTERPMASRIASQNQSHGEERAGWYFSTEAADARDLGIRIHALFEQIEWLASGATPKISGADPAAARLADDFLKNPRNHAFFERPTGTVGLLREQAFEAVLDGRWLSGIIDRLHLEKDALGKVTRAHIFDFKTDRKPDPEHHRTQMEDYRKAVSKLFACPPENIICTLLFVRTGDAIDL